MKAVVSILAVLGAACGPLGNAEEQRVEDALPPASTFKCSDLDGTQTACVDFNDGNATGFTSEGGQWNVVAGRYVGWGPDTTPGTCIDSLMTHAIFGTVQAQDFSMHAELASVKRVDKVIVFRSADNANRIQLNFRAKDGEGHFGDLMVQEIRDCAFVKYTQDGQIPLDHDMGDKLDVDLDVQGTHLKVQVAGKTVLDADEPIAVRSGRIGFGVIDHSETVFDDFYVRVRD